MLEDRDGKQYFTVKPEAFSVISQNQNIGSGGADKFWEYTDLTSKFEKKLDSKIVISILTECNTGGNTTGDIKTKMDALRNGTIEQTKIMKLMKYLNKEVNNEPIDIADFCEDIYLKDSRLFVTPAIEMTDW